MIRTIFLPTRNSKLDEKNTSFQAPCDYGDRLAPIGAYFGSMHGSKTVGEREKCSRVTLRITFVQYFVAFCSRPEATGDVISSGFVGSIIPDSRVKLGDPHIYLSREIHLKPSQAAFSTVFFRSTFRPEVAIVTLYIRCKYRPGRSG